MDILMPQLGETVTEGKITTWYKRVGDTVTAGESLFEIETDKTSMEVPTMSAGVLAEIRVQSGDTVPVGAVVAVMSEAAASTSGAATTPQGAARVTTTSPASARFADPFNAVRTPAKTFGPATLTNGAKATPVARRLAAMNGIDLSRIAGSGPHGRVVAKDVREHAAQDAQGPASVPVATAVSGPGATQVKSLFSDVPFVEVPLDNMRKIIARRLLEAKQTVPHFYLQSDVGMDKLVDVRTEMNAQGKGAYKLSINDFIIKALAVALQRVPEANVVWAEDRLLQFSRSDIGVAVAVEGGLFTPVIRDAQAKSIGAISSEMRALGLRARAKSLKPAEYQGGSISISNLGMFGVQAFSAIINPPQSAILAVGTVERRAFEAPNGGVRFGSVMTATLSCDHRAIDGALGAHLLAALKDLMQSPLALLA